MKRERSKKTAKPEGHQSSHENSERCTRCGLPTDWSMTTLDEQGVCNYCRYYDTIKGKLRDFDRWEQLFTNHINQHKGKFKYDAAVGFSGGKDSSYIAYMLKNHYKCNVLGVTVNFGFMPTQFALENSKRVADSLGIDHIIYDATSDKIQDGFKTAIKNGTLCGLCTGLCTAFTRKIAIEQHIPIYVMGSDRGQMLRSLVPETGPMSGARAISKMLTPYSDEKTRRDENPKKLNKMRNWLQHQGFSPEMSKEIYPDAERLPGTNAVPLSLQYFIFHPYHEKDIKNVLKNEANWQLPAGDHLHSHHDCDFHDAATYYFREAVGTTITTGEICVDVREGEILRDEAIAALQTEANHLDQIQHPYKVFEEYFDISEDHLHSAAKRFRRRVKTLTSLRKLQMRFSKPKLPYFDKL